MAEDWKESGTNNTSPSFLVDPKITPRAPITQTGSPGGNNSNVLILVSYKDEQADVGEVAEFLHHSFNGTEQDWKSLPTLTAVSSTAK